MSKAKKKDVRAQLGKTIADIEKAHGSGSVILMSRKTKIEPCEVIPSGCITMDTVIGPGGYPRGRIIELFGTEGGGKTTLALQGMARCQADGEICAYVDVEHAIDMVYAEKLGIDMDLLLFSQPNSGEEALDIVERLVRSGAVGMIVVDSVAALTPKAELEGEIGDSHMGLAARLMGQAMRKLNGIVSETNTVLIFINQVRSNIGGYGNPEVTTGGKALKFFASVRIDIRPIAKIKEKEKVIGNRIRIKTIKNRVGPPFVEGECDLIFGKGIVHGGEVFEQGLKHGVIERRGPYYYLVDEGEVIGASKLGAINTIEHGPVLDAKICGRIKAKVLAGLETTVVAEVVNG